MTNAIIVVRNFLSSSSKKRTSNYSTSGKGENNAAMNGADGTPVRSREREGSVARSNGDAQMRSDEGETTLPEESPDALLPRYLCPLVRHYHDDFYVSRSFDPRLVVQLMAEGFLPIATRGYLLPKLHVERCVLRLNPISDLHVSRSTRKKSGRFLLSVNECFDKVVAGCHRQHGTNWLYPPIVEAFRAIHQRTLAGGMGSPSGGVDAFIILDGSPGPCDVTSVRLYSVEVWNAKTGALAGGELGYSVGGIYSSLTGFSDEDAAGSSQLVALGRLLTRCGFKYWDLGMDLEYKRRLGAEMIRRADFVREVRRSRIEDKGIVLWCEGRTNAKDLVDWKRHGMAMDADTEPPGVAKDNSKDLANWQRPGAAMDIDTERTGVANAERTGVAKDNRTAQSNGGGKKPQQSYQPNRKR